MEAFAKATGIEADKLAYIVIPTFILATVVALIIGLNQMLVSLRANSLSPTEFLRGILRSVAVVILIIAFIYFLYKEYSL